MNEGQARQLAHDLSDVHGEIRARARQNSDGGWEVYAVTVGWDWVITAATAAEDTKGRRLWSASEA
jgi:hypothetical protein